MTTGSTGPKRAAEALRLLTVFGAMAAGLGWVGASLYRVQVVDSGRYADALEAHSMRRVRLPATRGRILDRHGVPLADNRPSYCVAVFVEELRRPGAWSNTVAAVDRRLDEIAGVIGRPREIGSREIAAHIHRRRPLPLLAWSGLDDRELARLAEHPRGMAGVDIYVQPERVYPLRGLAAHVVGYVGRGRPETAGEMSEAEASFDFYLPDLVGRHGIEQRYDAHLAGRPGGELIRVDAVGYKHEARTGRLPVSGQDVVLTLDGELQGVAEDVLRRLRGAVVVIDVDSGEVLVLASAPSHDLSQFVPFLPAALWQRLRSDPRHPLLNRAAAGIYPPGSIFKPVVALAALDAGIATPSTAIDCTGAYEMPGGQTVRCWLRTGHGPQAIRQALEQSCNVYFCQVGVQLGYEPRLWETGVALGLGRRPEIEIASAAGLLPTDAWKRRRWGDGWRTGDTANLAIGQGFLSVTPLQMAVMTAALANGGAVLRPRVVLSPAEPGQPSVVGRVRWRPESLAAVRQGLHDVVNGPRGTGRLARIDGPRMAGKTGTAEYYERGERRKHAWMIAYAPFEAPRYAIAVVVENSDSGGRAAAPIVHRVFSALFGRTPDTRIQPESMDEEAPPTGEPGGAMRGTGSETAAGGALA